MEWTMEHNIIYCRDILLVNPFQSKKGSVERGSLWTQIADNMNSLVSPKFIVTQRSVREHLAVLQKKYQKKMRQEEEASGISPEKTELDILLEEIYVAEQIGEEEQEEASRMNQEKTDQEQARADDVRRTAMETFAETQKRNGDEKEKKTKRKRRSGGEMVDYLKEKFESEQKGAKRGNGSQIQNVRIGGEETHCKRGDAEGCQQATNGDATCNAGPEHPTAETAAAAVSTTHATNCKLANDAHAKPAGAATGNARIF
ncbi:Hypothetical predicted protein [Paramuricea clavata]|uniref:Uncharacterized protein n=1 Tax=Paramuricea clavata TaxID=317549 RepID=A0A6S7KVC7_PARCT|nr:Hypothetical predicted protein [Paramuricea clavata]